MPLPHRPNERSEDGSGRIQRRDLVVLHLILKHLESENVRLADQDERIRYLLVDHPTVTLLWKAPGVGLIVDYFARYQHFDGPIVASWQIARVVNRLRSNGVMFDPTYPPDMAVMGNKYLLVPKPAAFSLMAEVNERCGTDPRDWPQNLQYNRLTGLADWENAKKADTAKIVRLA